MLFDAHVKPNRTVKGCFLVYQQVGQFCFESSCVCFTIKIAIFSSPIGDGFGYAIDQLLDTGLLSSRFFVIVEVFRSNNIDSCL